MPHRQTITIVAFGDSITHAGHQLLENRWPEILRLALQERFPECGIGLINAGVGGNTSREGLRRIEKDVLAHAPHFVLVEFGNDATPDPARHVAFEEYTANFERIRTAVEAGGKGRLILLTFPPVVDQWHAKRDDEFYKRNGGQDACQEHYRKLIRQFAHTHGLSLADIDLALRKEMAAHGPGECVLKDGVHLTARGNQIVAGVVWEVLFAEIERFLAGRAKVKQVDAG